MIYGVTVVVAVTLTLLCLSYRLSVSSSDAIALSIGMFVGLMAGAAYGSYLHQPHLLLAANRWPLFASLSIGSIVGTAFAIYTRDQWREPWSRFARWIVPRLSNRLKRYSIKSLLILTTLLCLFLGLHVSSYLEQKRAVHQLRRQGVTVEYRWPQQPGHLTPTLLGRVSKTIGPDHFLTPYRVAGYDDDLSDDKLSGLRQLNQVEPAPDFFIFYLSPTDISWVQSFSLV